MFTTAKPKAEPGSRGARNRKGLNLMTRRWREYLGREKGKYRGVLECAASHWVYHEPLFLRIRKAAPPPARILNVGCGWGFSDIYLQGCGYEVTGVDSDDAIIEEAKSHAQHFHSDAVFRKADAFDLSEFHGGYDLVFSAGLVEHFDRDDAVKLIREQANCASRVLVLIPTRFTKYAGTVTDERPYGLRHLRGMVEAAGLRVTSSFGYGDVTSPLHNAIRYALPYGVYRVLQGHFSYAMQIGCVGVKP